VGMYYNVNIYIFTFSTMNFIIKNLGWFLLLLFFVFMLFVISSSENKQNEENS